MKKITALACVLFIISLHGELKAQKVLLDENFSNNRNNWLSYLGKTTYFIHNGKLIFSTTDSLMYVIDMPATVDDGKDFSITATAVHTDGVEDRGYGITFGGTDANNYYSFCLASGGYYRLSKQNSAAGYSEIIKWTSSPLVKSGNYAENTMQLARTGTNWVISVNGQTLATVPAAPFMGNKIAFTQTYPQRVEYDDVKVIVAN